MNKLLFLCFVIFTTINHSQTKLPNVNLTTLNGKTVSIDSQISKDKITVLAFWATWCVPCINVLDAIKKIKSCGNFPTVLSLYLYQFSEDFIFLQF